MPDPVHPDLKATPASGEQPCKRCGAPTTALGGVCAPCLNAGYTESQWGMVREMLRARPHQRIALARDARSLQHLVMIHYSGMAWCGEKLTERAAHRRLVMPGKFPAGVCSRCLAKFEELNANPEKAT